MFPVIILAFAIEFCFLMCNSFFKNVIFYGLDYSFTVFSKLTLKPKLRRVFEAMNVKAFFFSAMFENSTQYQWFTDAA